jgi:hypothetical protein
MGWLAAASPERNWAVLGGLVLALAGLGITVKPPKGIWADVVAVLAYAGASGLLIYGSWPFPIWRWVAVAVVAGIWAVIIWRSRGTGGVLVRPSGPAPSPQRPTATIRGTEVGRLGADIDSSADSVADDSKINEWDGTVKHRPQRKRRR